MHSGDALIRTYRLWYAIYVVDVSCYHVDHVTYLLIGLLWYTQLQTLFTLCLQIVFEGFSRSRSPILGFDAQEDDFGVLGDLSSARGVMKVASAGC